MTVASPLDTRDSSALILLDLSFGHHGAPLPQPKTARASNATDKGMGPAEASVSATAIARKKGKGTATTSTSAIAMNPAVSLWCAIGSGRRRRCHHRQGELLLGAEARGGASRIQGEGGVSWGRGARSWCLGARRGELLPGNAAVDRLPGARRGGLRPGRERGELRPGHTAGWRGVRPCRQASAALRAGDRRSQCLDYRGSWIKSRLFSKVHLDGVSEFMSIDTNNTAVIAACTDLMKSSLRQFRYRLKKKYFDGVPANEVPTTSPVPSITDDQWRALVEMWSSTKHKNKCEANKINHGKVLYHQATGSRSYVAHGYVVKQELRYKENPPTPIDLFKDFHCSSKTGFAKPVKEAVAKMETILAEPEEGQVPKTAAEAFAEVLPSSRKFLQNAGFNPAPEKKNDKAAAAAAAACIQDLQDELEKKNKKSEALEEEVGSLKEQVVEANKAIEKLKKDNEETQSFLRLMVSFNAKN
ncbi:hypothetical protein PR202_gb25655 [Eleusine coracana subsp. coracana]|uniref:Uncharacterized protein n=1 Tax=Eleusine coracana subsp. coracana TaxID=191504 RepID=A0AAV5FP54_ELECO|nr:hypothetical protein PR202_gb25655 [Eleusine coracana subsp. coracana]